MDIWVSETIGTFILVAFGDGVVAGVLLRRSKSENGGWLLICLAWGLAVAMAVYAVGQYSGAHINAAVTTGLAIAGVTEWSDVPKYYAGEFLGAFLGAIAVYLAYFAHWKDTHRILARSWRSSARDPRFATTRRTSSRRSSPRSCW